MSLKSLFFDAKGEEREMVVETIRRGKKYTKLHFDLIRSYLFLTDAGAEKVNKIMQGYLAEHIEVKKVLRYEPWTVAASRQNLFIKIRTEDVEEIKGKILAAFQDEANLQTYLECVEERKK